MVRRFRRSDARRRAADRRSPRRPRRRFARARPAGQSQGPRLHGRDEGDRLRQLCGGHSAARRRRHSRRHQCRCVQLAGLRHPQERRSGGRDPDLSKGAGHRPQASGRPRVHRRSLPGAERRGQGPAAPGDARSAVLPAVLAVSRSQEGDRGVSGEGALTDLAVVTRGLTKRFGSLVAVDHLDLTVKTGELYGFLGPNGAGKSTTLRMLTGIMEATAGVDPVSRRTFWALIRSLADEGTTVLVTTHYMDEAELCDSLGFIYQGRLIASGSPEHIKRETFGRVVIELEAPALREAADVLADMEAIEEVVRVGGRLRLIVAPGGPDAEGVRRLLAERGRSVTWAREVEPSVEDLFVSFVDKERKSRVREQLRALREA